MGVHAKDVLLAALAVALILALPLLALCSVLPSQGNGVQWSSEDWYRGAPAVDAQGNLYLLVAEDPERAEGGDAVLRSLDRGGGLRWELPLDGNLLPPAVDAHGNSYLVRTSRTANDSALYGMGTLSSVVAVSPRGELRWTYDVVANFPAHGMVVPPVVPGDEVVYLALASGSSPSPELSYIAALGPRGELVWQCPVPGKVTSLLPPAPDRPLLAASSGNLSFIDRGGNMLRTVDLGVPGVQAGPVVLDDGTILVGVDAGVGSPPEVWGLDPEGARRWNITAAPPAGDAPDRAVKSILARGSAAFVLTSAGTEVQYRPEGEGTTGAQTASLPSVLLVVGEDGEVRATEEVPGEATLTGWDQGAVAFSRGSIQGFDASGAAVGSYPVPVGRWLNDLSVGPDGQMYLLQGGLWTGLVAVQGPPWEEPKGQVGERLLWAGGAAGLGLLLAWFVVRRR